MVLDPLMMGLCSGDGGLRARDETIVEGIRRDVGGGKHVKKSQAPGDLFFNPRSASRPSS